MTLYFIGFRTFAELDSRGTGEQEGQRENALRKEFMALVPGTTRLRACELVLQRHHSSTGCRLEYYLAQRPQFAFDFDGSGQPQPAGTPEAAAFQVDVARVQAECRDVKTRLVLAQSPTLGHKELTDTSPAALDRKAMRGLFRRQATKVVMPTPSGDLDLNLPAAPRHLPTDLLCVLSARVTKMTPNHMAHLRELSLMDAPKDEAKPIVTLPASLLACRERLSREDAITMLERMDDQTALTFNAQLQFDWATGAVKCALISALHCMHGSNRE